MAGETGRGAVGKIFGTPPSALPPDVPPIESDIRGSSIRRQPLEKPGVNAACAGSHVKIDPLGLALENPDAIGRLRRACSNGAAIDTTGCVSRNDLEGPADLAAYLRRHPQLLALSVGAKLLMSALAERSGSRIRRRTGASLKSGRYRAET
ncbi:MAG: hypothetical protein RL077_4922 [Verrucomicrobiota bacterium]